MNPCGLEGQQHTLKAKVIGSNLASDLDGFERKITLCNGAKQSLENPLIDFLRSASLVVFHGKKFTIVYDSDLYKHKVDQTPLG